MGLLSLCHYYVYLAYGDISCIPIVHLSITLCFLLNLQMFSSISIVPAVPIVDKSKSVYPERKCFSDSSTFHQTFTYHATNNKSD